jgi:hypothetical protein
VIGLKTLGGGRVIGLLAFEEVFGLFLELIKIWPLRKLLWHKTFLLSPVVR